MTTTFDAAWATETERPADSSMSQDDLIAEFHRLDAIVKEQGARRREIGMQLAGVAFENRRDQNTVHLVSTGGQRVKVEFGIDYEYETEQMMTAADLLGREVFDSLFKTRVEFTAKKRELKKFLNTVSGDERINTAKQIITEATITKDKNPYVSVE
jgi:hypothetical protein